MVCGVPWIVRTYYMKPMGWFSSYIHIRRDWMHFKWPFNGLQMMRGCDRNCLEIENKFSISVFGLLLVFLLDLDCAWWCWMSLWIGLWLWQGDHFSRHLFRGNYKDCKVYPTQREIFVWKRSVRSFYHFCWWLYFRIIHWEIIQWEIIRSWKY